MSFSVRATVIFQSRMQCNRKGSRQAVFDPMTKAEILSILESELPPDEKSALLASYWSEDDDDDVFQSNMSGSSSRITFQLQFTRKPKQLEAKGDTETALFAVASMSINLLHYYLHPPLTFPPTISAFLSSDQIFNGDPSAIPAPRPTHTDFTIHPLWALAHSTLQLTYIFPRCFATILTTAAASANLSAVTVSARLRHPTPTRLRADPRLSKTGHRRPTVSPLSSSSLVRRRPRPSPSAVFSAWVYTTPFFPQRFSPSRSDHPHSPRPIADPSGDSAPASV